MPTSRALEDRTIRDLHRPTPSAGNVELPGPRSAGRPLNEVGEEPDPRFTLANERTFLAWARTALGLLATGLAVAQLLGSEPRAARLVISVPLILMAGVIGVLSYPRWRTLERALRLSEPLPDASAAAPLGIGIALIAITATVGLVLR